MTRGDVLIEVDAERYRQDAKWGTIAEHPHEVGGWLSLMQVHLLTAQVKWAGSSGDAAAMQEVVKLAALAVACLEQHGR